YRLDHGAGLGAGDRRPHRRQGAGPRFDRHAGDAVMNETDIQAIFDSSPFIAFLGLKLVKLDTATQELTVRAPMRPEMAREAGTGQWHGGPIAAVIDTVGDFALAYLVGKP